MFGLLRSSPNQQILESGYKDNANSVNGLTNGLKFAKSVVDQRFEESKVMSCLRLKILCSKETEQHEHYNKSQIIILHNTT